MGDMRNKVVHLTEKLTRKVSQTAEIMEGPLGMLNNRCPVTPWGQLAAVRAANYDLRTAESGSAADLYHQLIRPRDAGQMANPMTYIQGQMGSRSKKPVSNASQSNLTSSYGRDSEPRKSSYADGTNRSFSGKDDARRIHVKANAGREDEEELASGRRASFIPVNRRGAQKSDPGFYDQIKAFRRGEKSREMRLSQQALENSIQHAPAAKSVSSDSAASAASSSHTETASASVETAPGPLADADRSTGGGPVRDLRKGSCSDKKKQRDPDKPFKVCYYAGPKETVPRQGCPPAEFGKCPPRRKLKPLLCDPYELAKAREAAREAALAQQAEPPPPTIISGTGSRSRSAARSASKKGPKGGKSATFDSSASAKGPKSALKSGTASASAAAQEMSKTDRGNPCEPLPTGSKACEGLDQVQAWQKHQMEQFFENHRMWRRGEQPSTPVRPRQLDAINTEPIVLPDSVQEFVDRISNKVAVEKTEEEGEASATIAIPSFSRTMDEVEVAAVAEIKFALEEKGAATYGLPNDLKIEFIHMLGKEVWCERSKVSLELQILRKLLVKATEEAEIAQAEAEAAYNALAPGAMEEIDSLIKEYKRIMDCLRPLRDRRRLLHHKAMSLCRSVKDGTEVLLGPVSQAIGALQAKRSGESPIGAMISTLGGDMLRSAYGLFGVCLAKCKNFIGKLTHEMSCELAQVAWASVALCEYLQLRGPHFPRLPETFEDMACEGPVPPLAPIPYLQWANARDSYLLYREVNYLRQILASHGFIEQEVACTFPAFPEQDRACILNGLISGLYVEDNVNLWKGKWAIKNAILNRTTSNPLG